MPKTDKRYSDRELRAIAYALADEIETRALPYRRAGMTRIAAINRVMAEMDQ